MDTPKTRTLLVPVVMGCLLLTGSLAWSQEAAEAPATAEEAPATTPAAEPADTKMPTKLADQWKDMLHYIRLARGDLAKNYAEAILAGGAQPRELYLLSTETPTWMADLARGSRIEGLKDTLDKIRKMIEDGYESERADPDQIAKAIDMLQKGVTSYSVGVERLKRSGEYAVPQLVQKLTDPQADDALKERIVTALPKLGKDVVRPLAMALVSVDNAKVQEWLARAIGEIGYPHAAPQLKELIDRKDTLDSVRKVAQASLLACGGPMAEKKGAAEMYFELAERYYYQSESVAPDARYEKANVWSWQKGLGLVHTAVPQQIFCDVYAMRCAARTLELDAKFYPAVSLWLAANLKRTADLPAGQADPTLAKDEPTAEFYALASPAKYLQHVLARALKDQDSAVAIGAIEALAQTAGVKSLVEVTGGAQPLVQALTYGDRRVQFLSAWALANARPDKSIGQARDEHVVMLVLAKAIAQTGAKRALISAQGDQANKLKDAVRAAGFELVEAADPAQADVGTGVDVIVLAGLSDPAATVRAVRATPALAIVPVVVASETPAVRALAEKDKRIVLLAEDADVAKTLGDAVALGPGAPMDEAEAEAWAIRAAEAVRMLGLTGTKVFNLVLVRDALVSALSDKRQAVQVAAAKALAVVNDAAAQGALAKFAIDAAGDEKVRVAAFAALAESIRTHGNQLADAASQAVLDVVQAPGSAELKNAAAQAAGAMNLPSEKIIQLIVPGK
ncbi:MAG TPA: hypothetical protein DCX07_11850 [Phycisphaerales bacterium]|nr:hypothetical protein [Phycisphaerales bacterium]